MQKKNYILITFVIIISFALLSIVLYYYSAFDTANNLVASANKGVEITFKGNDIISLDDYLKLQGVSTIKDENFEFYINGGTTISINHLSLNRISFNCKSDYKVFNAETNEIIENVTNRKVLINMQFKSSKWYVSSVSMK